MKPIKFVVLACSLAVILLTFVAPYFDIEGIKLTLWRLHDINPAETLPHPFIVLGAASVSAVIGVFAVLRGRLPRALSVLSLLCCAIGVFMAWAMFPKTHTELGQVGAIGAKLILGAFVASGCASLAGIVKLERVSTAQPA